MPTKRIDGWPALMTRETAALYLDVSPRHIDELQRQGKLIPSAADVGKRFPMAELDRYIDTLPEWQSA